jgi:small-conductance mechanosensitive channel/CRP-like cAMP-binding protein
MFAWARLQQLPAHFSASAAASIAVTALALCLILALRRLLPQERRRRGRAQTIALALALPATLAALAAEALDAQRAAAVLTLLDLLLLSFGAIGILDLIVFELALSRVRLAPAPILRDVLQGGAFFVLVLAVLGQSGVNVLSLVTTSAVITAVIGLALQSTIANLFAGLSLQLDDSLHIGDWIRVGPHTGRISQMNWRATCLLTKDGDTVIVPNAELLRLEVENYSTPTRAHRVTMQLNFHYDHAPNHVRRVLLQAVAGAPGVLDEPAPDCFPRDFGESAVAYALRFYIEDFGRDAGIEGEVRTRIWYAARRAGLEIPYPIRRVYMTEAGGEGAERDLEERLGALSRIELFAPLEPREKDLLAQGMALARFAAGERIIRQGEPGDSLFLIQEGEVSVTLEAEGAQRDLAILRPGEFFGEMSLMTGAPRASTCTARTDVTCYVLDQRAFRRLLTERPKVAEDISMVIVSRQMRLQAERQGISEEARDRRAREASSRLLGLIRDFFQIK